jgi:hypothetical protein
MKLTTTLLSAAALVAMTATSFAQVTPGGTGERKANQAPSTTATEAPAGTLPGTQPDYASPRGPRSSPTNGLGRELGPEPGDAGSGQQGARRANEAPVGPR